MFQNDLDKMSAVLARTWNYLSGLGQEPGWAVWQLSSDSGRNKNGNFDSIKQIPIRCPRNHRGTLCHLAWLLGCNRFVFKNCENKQFEEVNLRSVEQ